MEKLNLLGDLTPAQFLRDYWHKKPLLIRQAIPGFTSLLAPEELFKLAADEDVESRLITHFRQKWQMRHGPIAKLPSTGKKAWTLLVQGVNLHNDAADVLLRTFGFVPHSRLDDLMVSYATDGGGVGPHFDSYDVFLLQAHGRRRWRIGAQKDLSVINGMPLKILRNFKPQQEFVLEPGDLLYLPPQFAHDGLALGECMTYSIGFRAPAFQELGVAFLQFMSDTIELTGRYADPDLEVSRHPAEISHAMLTKVAFELNKIQFTKNDIATFLGEYLSEPKASTIFKPPRRPMAYQPFRQQITMRGVALSPKTRMLFQSNHVFINGESYVVGRADKKALQNLADTRRLQSSAVASATDDAVEAFYIWFRAGWLLLGDLLE